MSLRKQTTLLSSLPSKIHLLQRPNFLDKDQQADKETKDEPKEVDLKSWIKIESDVATSDTEKGQHIGNFHYSKMGKDVSGSEIKMFKEAILKLTTPNKDSSFYEGQGFHSYMKKAIEEEEMDQVSSPRMAQRKTEIELTYQKGYIYESRLDVIRETL